LAELIEYAFVVLLSAAFTGASVEVYSQYTNTRQTLETRAAFAALVELAHEAAWNGTSASRVAIPDADLACSSGVLTLTTSSEVENASIGIPCSFAYRFAAGVHYFEFRASPTQLLLEVR